MVMLCVKGTSNPDEFLFECKAADSVGSVTPVVADILEWRHKVRQQLYSGRELIPAGKAANATVAGQLEFLLDEIQSTMKNSKAVAKPGQYSGWWRALRDMTAAMFPKECEHKDGEEAAITHLYEMHDNPELDEDYRLQVWHCRTMLDPKWKENEIIPTAKAALWFSGKEMAPDSTIGSYCGNNEKSKVTVKVSPTGAIAPSKEPRMQYDEQREMRAYIEKRRAEINTLQESELRDLVVQQSRGRVVLPGDVPAASGELRTTGLRTIKPNAEVTTTDA